MVSDLQVIADHMKELHKNVLNPSEQASMEIHLLCTSHLVPVPDLSEIEQFYDMLHLANPKA